MTDLNFNRNFGLKPTDPPETEDDESDGDGDDGGEIEDAVREAKEHILKKIPERQTMTGVEVKPYPLFHGVSTLRCGSGTTTRTRITRTRRCSR